MKISVITPSVRPKGLEIIRKSLLKQTYKNWEWLVGTKVDPEIPEAIWVVDDYRGGFWSLNRIYNKLFKIAKGELVVTWQDWIYANPDALERFWENYEKTHAVVSGVGDQYEATNKWGRPVTKIWSDPRKTDKYGSFYECYPQDCEWNFAAIPKKALIDIGGMDEGLDFLGYGGDQLQACARLDEMGYKFYLDQNNESFTVRHSRDDFGGQEAWDKNHVLFNGKYQDRIEELKQSKKWPCVSYL